MHRRTKQCRGLASATYAQENQTVKSISRALASASATYAQENQTVRALASASYAQENQTV